MKIALPCAMTVLLCAFAFSAPAQAGPDNLTCDAFENELMQFERFQRYTQYRSRGIPGQVGESIDSGDPRGNPRYADLKASLDMPRHIWNFTESDMDDIRDRATYCKATAAEWETDGDPSNEHRRINQAMSVIEDVYRGAQQVRANRTRLQKQVDRVLSEDIDVRNAREIARRLDALNDKVHQVGASWTFEQIIRPSVAHYETWARGLLADVTAMTPEEMTGAELAGPVQADDILGYAIERIDAPNVIRHGESLYKLRRQIRSQVGRTLDAFVQTYVERIVPTPEDVDGTPLDLHEATLRATWHARQDQPLKTTAPEIWKVMDKALRDVEEERGRTVADYLCEEELVKLISQGIDLDKQVFNGRRRFVSLGWIACRIAGAGFEVSIDEDYDAASYDAPAIFLSAKPAYERVVFGKFEAMDFLEVTLVQGHPARPSAYRARHARDHVWEGDLSQSAWDDLLTSFRTEIRMGLPGDLTN